MVGPYRTLIRTPGTPRIFAGYFAGRLPAGMVTVAVALAFVDTSGGLTRVGLVIAAYSLAIAARCSRWRRPAAWSAGWCGEPST